MFLYGTHIIKVVELVVAGCLVVAGRGKIRIQTNGTVAVACVAARETVIIFMQPLASHLLSYSKPHFSMVQWLTDREP